MRAVLAALLLLIAPAVAQAAPRAETAEAGGVRATLHYEVSRSSDDLEQVKGLRLVVERDGAVVHDAPVTVRGEPCEAFCGPANRFVKKRSVGVRDLDRDGVPEVLVQLFTGGAHCCVVAVVWRAGGPLLERAFGSVGYRLREDGLFVGGDRRFDGAFAPHAGSAQPVQLLRLRGGRFTDVTAAEGRTRVRRDAENLWRAWRRAVRNRQGRWAGGVLAAWAADRYRLGARRSALRTLRREARRNGLPRGYAR
jgi:hypothetical protein